MDAFFGATTSNLGPSSVRVTCRNAVPGEWSYAVSKWQDRSLNLTERLGALVGFVARFFQPGVRSDLLFPGDRMLYARQFGRFVRGLSRRDAQR